jgi:hypothetical protein
VLLCLCQKGNWYLIGGESKPGIALATGYYLSLADTSKWHSLPLLNRPRRCASALFLPHLRGILMMGGADWLEANPNFDGYRDDHREAESDRDRQGRRLEWLDTSSSTSSTLSPPQWRLMSWARPDSVLFRMSCFIAATSTTDLKLYVFGVINIIMVN